MIPEERTEVFLASLDHGNTPFLSGLYEDAVSRGIPVIRPATQRFLKFLLAEKKPEKILEIGTAVGFSSLFMLEYGPEDLRLTTIEIRKEHAKEAAENFEKEGRSSQVTLLEGDAGKILPTLSDKYDLVFMDAAKGQYLHFLPDALRLLNEGGILLSDNVLMEGIVLESRFAVPRRDRTIHERMREYLRTLKESDELVTDILPVGDGVAVSVKR